MLSKHAKSPCCRARVRRFGGKRRQCVRCRRTWTIRPKKRGRPLKRAPPNLLDAVFREGYALRYLAQRRGHLTPQTFRHRFRQALRRFVARPRTIKLPRGSLILLLDGIRFQFAGRTWVLYQLALKSCHGKTAIFLDPTLLEGREGAKNWEQIILAIPAKVRARIRGVVVDNLRGMELLAKRHRWALQLCQFHLIMKLQVHPRWQRRALKGGNIRFEIYRLVREALTASEGPELDSLLQQLHLIAKTSGATRRIRAMVREFIRCAAYYRTCRKYPKLGLPATTNAVESMNCIVRDLLRRNRSASSPEALHLWATALIRHRSMIACNGKTSTD